MDQIEISLYEKDVEEAIQKKIIKLFRYYEFTNLVKKDYVIKITYKKARNTG